MLFQFLENVQRNRFDRISRIPAVFVGVQKVLLPHLAAEWSLWTAFPASDNSLRVEYVRSTVCHRPVEVFTGELSTQGTARRCYRS